MNYDELPREQSLEKTKKEAIELAVCRIFVHSNHRY